MQDWSAFCFVQAGQSNTEEDSEDRYLKDLALGDRLGDVLGEDVEEEVLPMSWRRRDDCLAAVGEGGKDRPTPAWLKLIEASPITKARVVTTSK